MKNLHLFRVRVIDATDYEGFRISIKSLRFNQRITINWPNRYNLDMRQTAEKYLKSEGFNIIGAGTVDDSTDILVCDTFLPLLKEKFTFAIYGRKRGTEGKFYSKNVSILARDKEQAETELLSIWECNNYSLVK